MKVHWVMSGMSSRGIDWAGGDTIDRTTGDLLEVLIDEPNFKNIWWLEKAIAAAKSVARVKLPGGSATGFLVGKDVFMTNNHVFENEHDAKAAKLEFNYRLLVDDNPATRDVWECDPEAMFKTNPDLDYTIVKVKKKNGTNAGDTWGALSLRHGASVRENQRVNIIQHPQGRFKEIAFRDNHIKAVTETYMQYITDTDYGSSGSPVFDDRFNVVALHNQRVPDPNNPHRWYRNQGFRVQAILNDADGLIP